MCLPGQKVFYRRNSVTVIQCIAKNVHVSTKFVFIKYKINPWIWKNITHRDYDIHSQTAKNSIQSVKHEQLSVRKSKHVQSTMISTIHDIDIKNNS